MLEMRIVVIQDSEDGKRTVLRKTCTRKIVNCYRMFTELREALAGGRALDEAKDLQLQALPTTNTFDTFDSKK